MIVFRFLRALWTHLRSGERLLPKLCIRMRYELCRICKYRKSGRLRESCRVCGCTVGERRWLLNKLAYPCEECPIKMWGKWVSEGKRCE